jgi:hypothetical protein
MKRFIYVSLLVMAAVFAVAAQTDFDEPNWTKYGNPREEFTVMFPNASVKGNLRDSDSDKSAKYLAVQNKTYFAVFSDKSSDTSLYRQIIDMATDGKAVPAELEIDGRKATRYDFKGADDFEHSFVTVQTAARFYIFHVISENRDNSMIDEFLGSVHFISELTPAAVKDEVPVVSQPAPVAKIGDAIKRSESITNSASAGITASPKSRDFNDIIAPPKSAKVDNAVTILNKPSASYTDLARIYEIAGMVRLRVTFEKNKEVSDITVLSKLPFGLTQSALRSARQIKFSPAVRYGDPYTSSKIVEYNFNVY